MMKRLKHRLCALLLAAATLCSLVVSACAATYDVNKLLDVIEPQIDQAKTSGMCLGWVASAFYSAYGMDGCSSCCAYHNGNRWIDSTSSSNIPVGAVVYFAAVAGQGVSHVTCGSDLSVYAGHIGIYVGSGYILHTIDMGDGRGTRVYKTSLSHIMNYWPWYKYRGWGWYGDVELAVPPKTISVTLDVNGGTLGDAAYTYWSSVKTTTTKPTESDLLRITGTSTQYQYFHYHNSYGDYDTCLDSIPYGSNWGYCSKTSATRYPQSMAFSDQGGRTSVRIGDACQYGYTYWFENSQTLYSYQTRADATQFDVTIGAAIGTLPAPTREGYVFDGWYTAKTGGTQVTAATAAGSSDLTLYARWSAASTPTTTLKKITNVVSGSRIYWNAVSGVARYALYRSETGKNGTYTWIAGTSATNYLDTNVVSGKTYYYKIACYTSSGVGAGDKSEPMGITYVGTPDITLRVNRSTGIGLGWNKIEGATGYAIYRKNYSGADSWTRVATITNPSTLTWTDTMVQDDNGSVYRYTIRALAGENRTTLSGCRNTGRTMARLTSRTLSSAVKASGTSITCKWSTTARASGYEVRFMVDGEVYKTFTVGNYATGTKTFTGLASGDTYKIQVRSYKKVTGVGTFYSAWSTAKNVTL